MHSILSRDLGQGKKKPENIAFSIKLHTGKVGKEEENGHEFSLFFYLLLLIFTNIYARNFKLLKLNSEPAKKNIYAHVSEENSLKH